MLSKDESIRISLEVNLFFQRIMKEHLFFIEINLQPVVPALKDEARVLKKDFEELLNQTIRNADGIISENVIMANDIVTPYTLNAEEVATKQTGALINTRLTKEELDLVLKKDSNSNHNNIYDTVFTINAKSAELLEKVIEFQKNLLQMSRNCNIFITLYDKMLVHDINEAEYYMELLIALQKETLPQKTLCEQLDFWNNIMGEHAEFIDGMLDPTEATLKRAAQTFVEKFNALVHKCLRIAQNQAIQESRVATDKIKDYKSSAVQGLLKCEIKSIIPPLLADHVLREANHYLRLL